MTSYAALRLNAMVMHQIRKTVDSDQRFTVLLTDEAVNLEAEDRTFLTTRFIKALSGRGAPVVEDRGIGSEVPSHIREIWSPGADFVEKTKEITRFLASLQPGSALEGLLVIANVSIGNEEALLISKVEHQEAMRLEPVTNAAGHQVFEIERIRDLVFGDTAKIYKVAVLVRSLSAGGVIVGEVVDDQNGNRLADYFLGTFLGMRLREEPAVLTERFLDTFTSSVNKSSMSAESKMEVQSALITELQSNSTQISPLGFIQNHVPNGFGPEVRSLVEDAHGPLALFSKDTNRIDSRIRRIRMDLSNGVLVIAPPDEIGGHGSVTVEHENDGSDTVRITGAQLKSIKGSGGR